MTSYPLVQNDGRVLAWIGELAANATVDYMQGPGSIRTFTKTACGGRLAFLEAGHDPEQMVACARIAYSVRDHVAAHKSWYLEAGAIWTLRHPADPHLYDQLRRHPMGHHVLPDVQCIGTPEPHEVLAAASAHQRSKE